MFSSIFCGLVKIRTSREAQYGGTVKPSSKGMKNKISKNLKLQEEVRL